MKFNKSFRWNVIYRPIRSIVDAMLDACENVKSCINITILRANHGGIVRWSCLADSSSFKILWDLMHERAIHQFSAIALFSNRDFPKLKDCCDMIGVNDAYFRDTIPKVSISMMKSGRDFPPLISRPPLLWSSSCHSNVSLTSLRLPTAPPNGVTFVRTPIWRSSPGYLSLSWFTSRLLWCE